jgi:hypothetical protein
LISNFVTLRPVATGMCFSINFDRETRVAAKEIEHIPAGGVLATELEALGSLPKRLP